MKKWAFVSDFDGTISNEDFYWLVINTYFPEGRKLFQKWKSGDLLDIDFLQKVFLSIHQDEEKIIEDIVSIAIDDYVPSFFKKVQENHGDVYILSAGTDYYIHHLLQKYEIDDVTVISNPGFFRDKNIHLTINENDPHYSKRYGIDKAKIILQLKSQYEKVFFIGDSEPDSHPAVHADITFAKDSLQEILQSKDVPFVQVETFKEVEQYLQKKGVISL